MYLAKIKKYKNFISPQVPYLLTLHDIKIITIEEMKNPTLGHLQREPSRIYLQYVPLEHFVCKFIM
jgi:hypothetical protein